jgi:glycosyltransferase involved in cell wall biosynthesis
MKIVFISDNHLSGGAAIAATRLTRALGSRGHETIRFVSRSEGADLSPVHEYARPASLARRLALRAGIVPSSGFTRLSPATVRRINAMRPDWISLHNIHGQGLRVGFIHDLAAPVLWTLHDMWSFTGRCAYDGGCPKYADHCDAACATQREYPSLPPRVIAAAHQEKRRLFREHPRLHAVTPSDWMRTRAIRGGWDADRVTTIHNPLDPQMLKPVEKAAAKQALGLPLDRPVIGFGAMNPDDPRKGGPLLVEVFSRPAAREASVLTFGSRPLPLKRQAPCLHLGTIESEALLALYYSACDLFLHPSAQDNFPNTVCESMICGTPVLATRDSGAGELIECGISGWLIDAPSANDLACKLERLIASPEHLASAGQAARRRALHLLSPTAIADAYVELAERMMAR